MKHFYILTSVLVLFSFSIVAQNVGIGEASPNTKLEIKGDGSDLLNIKDGSNDSKLFIDNAGNVGIGTPSPNEKLDVRGVAEFSDEIRQTGITGTYYHAHVIPWTSSNVPSYLLLAKSSETAYRVSGVFTGYRSSGSSANTLVRSTLNLTVGGGGARSASLRTEGESSALNNPVLVEIDYSGDTWIAIRFTGSTAHYQPHHMSFNGVVYGTNINQFEAVDEGSTSNETILSTSSYTLEQAGDHIFTGDLKFEALGSGVLSSDANGNISSGNIDWSNISGVPGEKWSGNDNTTDAISRTGNVGIGTTPSYKLDVNGDIRAQNRMYVGTGGGYFYNDNGSRVRINQDFYTNNSNTYLYANNLYLGAGSGDDVQLRGNQFTWTSGSGGIINTSGNVGIGTGSPSQNLEVTGGSYPAVLISNNSSGRDLYLAGGSQSSLGTTEAVIGVTSGNLHIDSRTSNQIYFQHYAQNNSIFNANGGRVGIGTSSPAKQLHVSGDARVDGSQGLEVRYGLLGGYNQSAPGSGNWGANIWSIGSSWNGSGYGQSFNVASGQYGLTWLRQSHPSVNSVSNEGLHIYRNGGLAAAIGYEGAQFTSDVIVDGDLGVGLSNPGAPLEVAAGGGTNGTIAVGRVSGNPNIKASTDGSGHLIMDSRNAYLSLNHYNSDDVVLVNGGGDVGVGTNSPSYKLHVNGRIRSNGINETSDIRFKKDIQPLESSLEKVMQLQGVSYYWKKEDFPNRKFKDGKDLGVIAQEVEKILPEVVDTDNEGYKSVQYSHLVPVLIEAIKEQQEIIEAQKAENRQQKDINHTQSEQIEAMAKDLNQLNTVVKELQLNQEMTKK